MVLETMEKKNLALSTLKENEKKKFVCDLSALTRGLKQNFLSDELVNIFFSPD